MSSTSTPGTIKNPWISRARKFLVAGAIGAVEIANLWANGPEWVYGVAPVVVAVLVYFTGNAPEYRDPRGTRDLLGRR